MRLLVKAVAGLLAATQTVQAFRTSLGGLDVTPGQILYEKASSNDANLIKRATPLTTLYPEHNLSVPVDHFPHDSKYAPHSNDKFNLRYWFDAQYYKPGGPVIVLQSGETSGVGRLPFLQKGIVYQLAKATNGIGVILEHRYYGTSFPVPDLSVKNLRFLTTEQALADEAYFAQNVKFPGLEKYGDLTSKTTPYIGYGGSYAGSFNAFLRKTHPDAFWGAISSSGVTKAIWDYWAYFKPIADYAPKDCIKTQQTLTHIIDKIVIDKKSNKALTTQLKQVFGLQSMTYTDDVTNLLAYGIYNWQSLNWDPDVSDPEFFNYCGNITKTSVQYPATEKLRGKVTDLIQQCGSKPERNLVNQMLNYIGYVGLTAVAPCQQQKKTLDQCYTQRNTTFYRQDSLDQYDWRSWPWQYCTEYGFLQTGSGVPKNELPLISRTIDLEYLSTVCREAFNITKPANVDIVNKYGGYDISYPRLAIIDGDRDPWREATPHAYDFGAKPRQSTTSEPFVLIQNAVHHFDENGRFPNETTPDLPPKPVADAQRLEVQVVREWVREWHEQHPGHYSL